MNLNTNMSKIMNILFSLLIHKLHERKQQLEIVQEGLEGFGKSKKKLL